MNVQQIASHRRQLSGASTLTPSVPSTRRTSATSLLTHVDETPLTTAPPSSANLSGLAGPGQRQSDHQPQIPRLSQLKGNPYAAHRWKVPNPRFDWTTPPYGAGPGSNGCETWADNMTDWLEAQHCGEHGISTGGKTDWVKTETEQGRGSTNIPVGGWTEYSKGPLYPDATSDKFNRLEHNVFLCLQRNAGESLEDWRTRLEPLSTGNDRRATVSVDLESIEKASGIHQDV